MLADAAAPAVLALAPLRAVMIADAGARSVLALAPLAAMLADAAPRSPCRCSEPPQKVRLYGDRPPLIAAADAARQKAQVPIWEREERERQQFLGQVPAHLQACSDDACKA